MIYQLYDSDIRSLASKPETGMGYQIIRAELYGSHMARKFVVYNSEIAIDLNDTFLENKTKLFSSGVVMHFSESKWKFDHITKFSKLGLDTASIRVLNKSEAASNIRTLSFSEKSAKKRNTGGVAAIDAKAEYADGKEIFVRLSAFEDDRRIDFVANKLKEGSFTTTTQDYKDCCSSGDDPVDRYALPNDEEIKWAFYIQPTTSDYLQRGTVQPAFGHAGGGIECYFANGTSNNTYLEKKEYGK